MSDSRTSSASPGDGHDAGGDALSVREAARIKGVSYSAALRAIRTGRLLSRRVGRTILVSPGDLDRWDPGRAAGRDVDGTPTDSFAGPTDREAALLSRMAWLSGVLASDSDDARMDAICGRLVADAGLTSASAWTLSRSGQYLTPLVTQGGAGDIPERISLRETGAALSMLRPGLQEIDGDALLPAGTRAGESYLVAPIRADRQLTGLVMLVAATGKSPLRDDDRRWADLLVSVLSADVNGRRRQELDGKRSGQLQAVIDALPDAAAITDDSARILVANRAFRMQFGLLPESIGIGVDLATLLGQVEYLSDEARKRSVVPRLRAALADAETTTLPLALAPAPERGTDRLVITPIGNPGRNGEQSNTALIRIVSPPTRAMVSAIDPPVVHQGTDAASTPELAPGLVEIDPLIDFVTALGAGAHLNDVLIAGVDELRDILGASAGSTFLRREDGQMIRLWPVGYVETASLRTEIDPTEVGAIRRAIAHRTATLLLRSSADETEAAALDRAGSDGGIIIPMVVEDDVIGLVVLVFFAEPTDVTPEQLSLATSLGRYLASAISNARNWDRWGVAQRHLLTVIDQLPQGVVVVDATDRSLQVANRAADDLWGREISGSVNTDDVRALGDTVRDQAVAPLSACDLTIHDANGEPFPPGETPIERTLRLGERRPGEPLTVVRADGTTVRVLGTHVPIRSGDGRILSAVGVFQDIEQFREVDRAKDEFLSVIAHELRNPLTSLRGNLQLLQRRLRRRDDAAGADDLVRLDGLIEQTSRIDELVGRLLDVSRADLDQISLECLPCDGAGLVRHSVETARGLAVVHTLVAELPDELPVVWDRVRIAQVLDNLLSNAIKYADAGEIRVAVTQVDAHWVEISVQDAGPGIPDSARTRVFERYFRVEADGPGSGGLGIGLFISARIVAAHHGTIAVTDAPGGGSRFTVRLPRDASRGADAQIETSPT